MNVVRDRLVHRLGEEVMVFEVCVHIYGSRQLIRYVCEIKINLVRGNLS